MTETPENTAHRTRRALLLGAAGAAAAAAATAIVPAAALAHDPDDVQHSVNNATTGVTALTNSTPDVNAFEASAAGKGVGVLGRTEATVNAGVIGIAGSDTNSVYATQPFDIDAGVYGYSAQTDISSGVVAEGPTAVYAYGDWGVYADGGTVGVFAGAYPNGTAVHAHAGTGTPAPETINVALRGTVSSTTQIGVQAYGKVQFPNRSGRVTFTSGQSSKAVTVSGATSTNYALAVLNSNKTGVYVRAVVPAAGKITIYLNKAVTSSTVVAWLVLG